MESIQDHNEDGIRLRWARACAAAGLWCLTALVLTLPKGLLPFGLLLLGSSLLIPLRLGLLGQTLLA